MLKIHGKELSKYNMIIVSHQVVWILGSVDRQKIDFSLALLDDEKEIIGM